ncbi:hypothetical protein ACFP1Z_30775 [Streptomyces gamaensis]|uniref:SGNH hydrolase-type esterase domain-containing protein n=1 Tax=Streptomyces gamaensis TaxID=1763542 RepID=A0ABW0Z8U1_9ACTN
MAEEPAFVRWLFGGERGEKADQFLASAARGADSALRAMGGAPRPYGEPRGARTWSQHLVAGLYYTDLVNRIVSPETVAKWAGCAPASPVATTADRRDELELKQWLATAEAQHQDPTPDVGAGIRSIVSSIPGLETLATTVQGLASELWVRAVAEPAEAASAAEGAGCLLPAAMVGAATGSPAAAAGAYAVCSQIPSTQALQLSGINRQFRPFTEQELGNLTCDQLQETVPRRQDVWENGLEVTYYIVAPGIWFPDVINPVEAYSAPLRTPEGLARLGFWSRADCDRFRELEGREKDGKLTDEEVQEYYPMRDLYRGLQQEAPKAARQVLGLSGDELLRAYTRVAKLHGILGRQGTPDEKKLIEMLGTTAVVAPWELDERCPAPVGTLRRPQVLRDESDSTVSYVFNAATGVTGRPKPYGRRLLRDILDPAHEGDDTTVATEPACAAAVYGAPSLVQINEDAVALLVMKGKDGRNVAVLGPDRKLVHEYMHVHQNLGGNGANNRKVAFKIGSHRYETVPNEAYAVGGTNLTAAMWKAEHPGMVSFLTPKDEVVRRRVQHDVTDPHTEAADRALAKQQDALRRKEASCRGRSNIDRWKCEKVQKDIDKFGTARETLLAKMNDRQVTIAVNEHTAFTASARRDAYNPRCDDSNAVTVNLPISDGQWDYVIADEERAARVIGSAVRATGQGQLHFEGWAEGGMAPQTLSSRRSRRDARGGTDDWTCSAQDGQRWYVSFGDSFQGEGSRHVGIPALPLDAPATLLTNRLKIEGERPGVHDPNMTAFSGRSAEELYSGTYRTASGDPGCHRALWSPARLAAGDGVDTVQFGCSGATTATVLTDTPWKGQYTGQIKQFKEWWARNPEARPEIVDISIGGNDLEVSSILKWCIATDLLEVHGHSLLRAPGFIHFNKCNPDGPLKDAGSAAYRQVAGRLVEIVQEIKEVFTQHGMTYGDDYRIVLKSYPQIFPPERQYQPSHPTLPQEIEKIVNIGDRLNDLHNNLDNLPRAVSDAESALDDLLQLIYPRAEAGGFPVDAQSVSYLRKIGKNLNQAVKSAGYIAGVDFLDLAEAFDGHELGNKGAQFQQKGPDQTGADGRPVTTGLIPVSRLHWVNPLILTDGAQGIQESFHPGFPGYQAISSAMRSFYEQVMGSDGLMDGKALVDSSSNPGRTTATARRRDSGHGLYRLSITDIKHVEGTESGGTSELFGMVLLISSQDLVRSFYRTREQWRKYGRGESMLQDGTPVETVLNGEASPEDQFMIRWKILEADWGFWDSDDSIGSGRLTIAQRQLAAWRAEGTLACHRPHTATQTVESEEGKVEIQYKIEWTGGACAHVPPPPAAPVGETPARRAQREREEAARRLLRNSFRVHP